MPGKKENTRILVISDTHIPLSCPKLPEQIIEELKRSCLCIHAGDFIDIEVANEISKHTELKAVRGNMDSEQIQKKFPNKLVITIGDVKIGLTHGGGPPFNIMEKISNTFSEKIDLYIFGHTHVACDEIHKGKIFFNPGSATDKVFAKFSSYGILNITGKNVERKIIRIDN